MGSLEAKALNIADLRAMARRRLPKGLFEFIDRGSEDEVALANNRAALDRIKLKPRVLVDVSKRAQEITLFGKRQAMPIVIAPTGPTGQVWYRGEIALARAAAAAGIPFTVSSAATTPMEEIVREGGDGTKWFQLYMSPDRARSLALVERAQAAGFEALVFTVDSIVPTNREFCTRNGFSLPFRLNAKNALDFALHPRWLLGTMGRYLATTGVPKFVNYPIEHSEQDIMRRGGQGKDASLTWEVLRTIRKMWPRPLIVKGIHHVADAVLAADCGADGIIVSNHGGVAFDSAVAPIDLLPEMLDAVGARMTVFVDSGFRRGSDVVKAMALGAAGVFIGRATLYAVAAAGEDGARRALAILRDEIDRTLAAMGCPHIGDLTRDQVVMPGDPPLRHGQPEQRLRA
ncbi:MAG: alpha-hydroxy-acid oxidizing protein [Variibacter sp.]|nr:alpha-hydroxy-acid oxidizing protein [Variibacter sp.]